VLALKVEQVADDDTEPELEQRHRDPELNREHARDDHDGGKHGCELDRIHSALHNRRRQQDVGGRGHQRCEPRSI